MIARFYGGHFDNRDEQVTQDEIDLGKCTRKVAVIDRVPSLASIDPYRACKTIPFKTVVETFVLWPDGSFHFLISVIHPS